MEKDKDFQKYLDKATKSVRRTAARKKLSYAVSDHGVVKIIHPDKSEFVVKSCS